MYTNRSRIIDLATHNSDVDHRISTSLSEKQGQINKSTFDWLLAIQVNNLSTNNAETSDDVSNDNLYTSITLQSAPQANLYAKPSDYDSYAKHYGTLTNSEYCTTRLNFLNALCPLSLHWQSGSQPISDEIIDNLPLHKQQALRSGVPASINTIKQELKMEQPSYFQSKPQINDLADALLEQIQQANY